MKQKHLLVVRGKEHSWLFITEVDPCHVQDMRDDGLEINEAGNSIPYWIAGTLLTRPWLFVQDVVRFRNPFRA